MLEDPDDQSHGVTIYEPCGNCDGKGGFVPKGTRDGANH